MEQPEGNKQKISLSSSKPRLSFWQIWNMSFGFLGIQFGFALQNANTSRIFETLGADTKNLAFYWLAAPLTGLLVQPIIGYYSDRTWHPKWGRRRPFFAIGAILASAALIFMPNSPTLWMAIGMLWIMDASINVSMEPFRAFVGDMLPPEQRTMGFATQSFFIGIGAVVASALPWIFTNWFGLSNTGDAVGEIPPSVHWAYYIGAAAFFGAVMWTVFTTKEYPPDEAEKHGEKVQESYNPLNIRYKPSFYFNISLVLLVIAGALSIWFYFAGLDKELYVLSGIFGLFGICYMIAAYNMFQDSYDKTLVQIVRDFQNMPKTMVQLAFVQFFSWFALFSMWIYTTSGVTSHIYDMKLSSQELTTLEVIFEERLATLTEPESIADFEKVRENIDEFKQEFVSGNALATVNVNFVKFFLDEKRTFDLDHELEARLSTIQKQYNDGADWVGILFMIYNGIAAIVAFLIPVLARFTGRRVTHLIALFCGGIGLASFYFIADPDWLIVPMIGVGIAWASILSVPYAMLSSSLPAKKMGYYMGIFNFFIVIPQIVAASILGFLITQFFNSEFIFALIIGGASMILAGLLSLMVDDKDEVLIKNEG
ncbi:MAG: MFS transporter [Candidatus Cyclobacteriaceae bacterium M2_1C_046]